MKIQISIQKDVIYNVLKSNLQAGFFSLCLSLVTSAIHLGHK